MRQTCCAGNTAQDLTSQLSQEQEITHALRDTIKGLEADLATKGNEIQTKDAQVELLTQHLDELQAAVAQLEQHFDQHKEEADSRNAQMGVQLKASHAQARVCLGHDRHVIARERG